MEKAKPSYQKPSSANKARPKVKVPITPPPMPWLPKNQKKEAERKAQFEKKFEEDRKKQEEEALAAYLISLSEWKPKLETLKEGEKLNVDQFSYYTKLSEEGSIELINKIEKNGSPFSGGDWGRVHSRAVCPLCSKKQILEIFDSWCGCCDAGGEERKICSDPKCGIYFVFYSDSRD